MTQFVLYLRCDKLKIKKNNFII